MNKLQEILEEFDNLPICFNYGERATMRRFLSEKLPEYARSKVPEKVEDFLNEDSYADIYTGHNECIDMFISSIEQDLQSLNN